MIRFYPRDIGLWRKTFVWNGISEPSKKFDDIESLKQFCGEHGVNVNDENFPFYLESCGDYVMGKQFTVMQWTCIGWVNEEREVPAVSSADRSLFAGIGSSESFTVEGAKKAFGVEE